MTFRNAAAVVAAGLALLVAPGVAQASESVTAAGYHCVNKNDVNYRSGPGTGYRKLGTVMKGQGFVKLSEMRSVKPADGSLWFKGDFWGGAKGIWVHSIHISWCS
ncbi:hypothetical protein SAMN04488074_10711 [Lentzea albidocapillata subsp. violacea]|uniref:SH3 domain-containing protein n=1 Tax=Lentzea albidocapillata subsp. violacea TaxID=128104 RepID=A0A1G9EDI5_9PSEU|nr:SH3 domain-containing protein [Lentzea albidocapillata]SDK74174.1 hypothetical protein SAMN04488074_10711 [Lentzea albidocapillata subsp. violacea]